MSTVADETQRKSTEPTSQAVVTAVAAERGTDPLDLEPLYSTLDPDALDALFEGRESASGRGPATVEFTYEGCAVCVTNGGPVEATALGE